MLIFLLGLEMFIHVRNETAASMKWLKFLPQASRGKIFTSKVRSCWIKMSQVLNIITSMHSFENPALFRDASYLTALH